MPTLEWIGKDKVINHHQQVPYMRLKILYPVCSILMDSMHMWKVLLRLLKIVFPLLFLRIFR